MRAHCFVSVHLKWRKIIQCVHILTCVYSNRNTLERRRKGRERSLLEHIFWVDKRSQKRIALMWGNNQQNNVHETLQESQNLSPCFISRLLVSSQHSSQQAQNQMYTNIVSVFHLQLHSSFFLFGLNRIHLQCLFFFPVSSSQSSFLTFLIPTQCPPHPASGSLVSFWSFELAST